MAAFVLVHGSNCGGWVWTKVAPLLRARGCEVYTPTLSGMADRAHLLPCGITLSTHITDIVNLLNFENLYDVILVGHSYAGMVITGAAARAPEHLKQLVYLDAYLPDAGQSEADLWPADIRAARQADAEAHGGVTQPPPLAAFGVTDQVLAEWVQARWTPQPFATYAEPIPDGSSTAVAGAFIRCTGNPAGAPDLFGPSMRKAETLGWPVRTVTAGHMAMLTAPTEVADVLLDLAGVQIPIAGAT